MEKHRGCNMTYTEYKIIKEWIEECPEITCDKEAIKYFYGTQFMKDRILRIQLHDAINEFWNVVFDELHIYYLVDKLNDFINWTRVKL
jgi:hypothetical protein